MLTELRCSEFQESPIFFHQGLNVVLGDDMATNSIGKSSILMILDFIFGGNDFIKFDNGAIANVGHHYFDFCLSFNDNLFYFRRGTSNPDIVCECNQKYEVLNEFPITMYTEFLRNKYKVSLHRASFRQFVGLFSRVWGKKNLNASKPLNIVPENNMTECIVRLIDFFNMFQAIDELDGKLKAKLKEKNSLLAAFKHQFIKRIDKKQYNKNRTTLERIVNELTFIKEGLARRMCDMNQILNTEIFELKIQKDKYVNDKTLAKNKLKRIDDNIKQIAFKHTGEITKLKNFFPEIDESKLNDVEEFHLGISKILIDELNRSRKILSLEISDYDKALNSIDIDINQRISAVANASPLVDKIFSMSSEYDEIHRENSYFETEKRLATEHKSLQNNLNIVKSDILKTIQSKINTNINDLVKEVYGTGRQSPTLELEPSRYSFKTVDDTGTGKFYSNLILFDLSIFNLTGLPFLMHDSILFKNIENRAVNGLISLYLNHNKQSFISIDEIIKYNIDTQKILRAKTVTNLSDEKLLYTKDWRKKG